MLKFKIKEKSGSGQTRAMLMLIAPVIVLLGLIAFMFSDEIIGKDKIILALVICCIAIGLIMSIKGYINQKGMLKKYTIDDAKKGFFLLEDRIFIIGKIETSVEKSKQVEVFAKANWIHHFNLSIEFNKIKKMEIYESCVSIYFETNEYILDLPLKAYCESQHKLGLALTRKCKEAGFNILINDNKNEKKFTADKVEENLDTFIKIVYGETIEEEDPIEYTEEEGIRLIREAIELSN